MKSFDKVAMMLRRASGTVEEYDERDMLLQDIITRMDDFQQLQAAENHLRRAKDDGIEASGALMRRLAMGELEESCKVTLRQPMMNTRREMMRARVAIMQAPPARVLRKRTIINSNGRATKATKLERVSAVSRCHCSSHHRDEQGGPREVCFSQQCLQFEKEEAEKAREHEIKMELRRQEAERARDERLLAVERERENFMMRLMEIALGQSNTNK
ncbi:hypothetical protein GQ600_18174 [Phytophthora cactorum]|nr:hypothetical protein GQ600_18174 [Phytophthora cactorum]